MQLARERIMSIRTHADTVDATSPDSADAALVARIAGGDRQAFEAFFNQHGERVFRYAFRLINDAGKAEEVTNDVMLEVWKTAPRFEQRSKVSTWLLGITRNLALNAVRRKQVVTVDLEDAPEPVDHQSANAEAEHDQLQLRAVLREALTQLSPEHRDVIELTFFHGCTYQHIAEIVQCPVNTVKTRMFHARAQLKRILGAADMDLSSMEEVS